MFSAPRWHGGRHRASASGSVVGAFASKSPGAGLLARLLLLLFVALQIIRRVAEEAVRDFVGDDRLEVEEETSVPLGELRLDTEQEISRTGSMFGRIWDAVSGGGEG
jgi:hypothetical protein